MSLRLEVNPIACAGHGLCADLLPELIELDEWGFPIIHERVPASLASHARRAVSACPALALKLTRAPAARRETRGAQPEPAARAAR